MRPQRPPRADVRAPAPRRRPRAVTCLFPRLCAQAGVGAQPQDLRHRYHLQWLEHLDADAVQIWYCERPLVLSSATPGDALYSLRQSLKDNNNVLQSWDPTLVNPCTWFHVTCNPDNSVIRLDLGNAQLSGPLVPQLGQLKNMQYLELYSNNISGPIPPELGNLTNLVSLDLYLNNFTGGIPDTLGQLSKLRFLRLNNNSLSGQILETLTNINTLQVLDLSNNNLSGGVPSSGSFSLFTPISFANNPNLCGPGTTKPCPGAPPFSPPPPYNPPSPASSKGLQIAMLAASW